MILMIDKGWGFWYTNIRKLKEVTKMYRVYVYYLKGKNKKDFEKENDAISYVYKIGGKGKAVRLIVEDMDKCSVILDYYPQI